MLSSIKKYFLKNYRFLAPIALVATALLSGSNESQDKKKDLVKVKVPVKVKVAVQHLRKIENIIADSDFFKNLSKQKTSISTKTTTHKFIEDSLLKIFSSSDQKDELFQNALMTISSSYGFFNTPKDNKDALTEYLKDHGFNQQSDILLNLIGAMDQLGLKNIDPYKIILEDTLRQLIDKNSLVVTSSNYKQLLGAFTYLDKDRKHRSKDPFPAWFKSTYKSVARKAEIKEFILPYIDTFFKSFAHFKKQDTDRILTKLLLKENKDPVNKRLLVLHTHLIFFSTDDLDKIKNYLQSRELDELITLVEALDFLIVEKEKIDKKADVLEQIIVKKIKKEGVKKETYSTLLETLKRLSKKTTGTLKHTLKNPTCTFQSTPKGSSFIGAEFIKSGEYIWLFGSGEEGKAINIKIWPVNTTGLNPFENPVSRRCRLAKISFNEKTITWLYTDYKRKTQFISFLYKQSEKWSIDSDERFARSINAYALSPNGESLILGFFPRKSMRPFDGSQENKYGLMSKIKAESPRDLIFWFSDPNLNPKPTPEPKAYDLLSLWSPEPNLNTKPEPFKPRAHATTITSITCSPDNTFVVSTAENDPVAKVWDAGTGYLLKSIDLYTPALSSAISKDSALIAMGGENGIIFIVDNKNNKLLGTLKTNSPVYGLDWSPDGKILLVRTKKTNHDISLWSVEKKVCLSTLNYHVTEEEDSDPIFGPISAPKAIFSPGGDRFLVHNNDEVSLWYSQPQRPAVDWFETTYKMFEPVLNKEQ